MQEAALGIGLLLIAVAVPLALCRWWLLRAFGYLILGGMVLLIASLPFQLLGLWDIGRILRWPLFLVAGVLFVGWLLAPPKSPSRPPPPPD